MDLYTALPANGDVRIKNWPLMQSIWPSFIFTVAYLIFVFVGRKSMKSKKAFELRKFMFVYNIVQVVVCAYITYEAAYAWIKDRYSFLCQPVDYSKKDTALRACIASWWFYIMKIVDLLDTVIFVLRKKNDQITFLHVYHHVTMVFCGWMGAKYVGGGQSLFIVILNSFIHVVMYTYYGLSACGPKIQKYLWWKRYLTQAQIIQFLAVITHSVINLITPCNFPKVFDLAFCLYGVSILILFSNFYIQNYIVQQVRRRRESHSK